MNSKQRVVLICAAAAVIIAMLFPPFDIRFPNGVTRNIGYGFLFSPAEYATSLGSSYPGSVNVSLLAMEWAAIILVAAVAWWLLKD